ncbi:short chain dehydrogenase [Vibrio maritimus]|uniref:Short chain dehydrogenase n=1 Tax=Vibrio maritimus TaxID=990268 RepID=A0A090TWM2_9VIBR|nr:short chain dehydrogenase [Vibrio maritimus]
METVFITGISRGIGLELAKQYLALGWRVIGTHRGEPSSGLIELLNYDQLSLLKLEVTAQDSVKVISESLSDVVVDVLINNAGVIGSDEQSMLEIDPADWMDTFAVNTVAPLMVTRELLPFMAKSPRPRVITISSQMGSLNRESTGMYAYRSSKAAVNKVMQVLSVELKESGIIVCPIHPGWVQTDMGGSEADITVTESAAGIISLIDSLTMASTGRFWTWNGQEHEW